MTHKTASLLIHIYIFLLFHLGIVFINVPPIQGVLGTLSPGVKRLGHEVDHSPPASAKVKKTLIYISSSPYAFMV
jgi:hypothetical protein